VKKKSSTSSQIYYSLSRHPKARLQNQTKPNHTKSYPNGASASAPPAGRKRRGQRPATRDASGSARADRERHTSPEANKREPARTALSATEAPTKKTKGSNNGSYSVTLGAGGSPAGRRKDPGARACNAHEPNPHHRRPHEAPGARVRVL
jgi:hypothetical protein